MKSCDQVLPPCVESRGLEIGEDVFLVYSPEREDPGTPECVDTRNAIAERETHGGQVTTA